MEENNNIAHIRHSLAHLLAIAVLEKYPDAKLAIGPATQDGFYYDFEFSGNAPGADELNALEERMRALIKNGLTFEHIESSAEDARKRFAEQPYKLEIVDELEKNSEEITLYKTGDFIDLCRGGHVESTDEINPDAFALERVAGAYWRGDENNTMLTRIYGIACETPEELEEYKKQKEEAAARDHRKIGKELDLFTFSELVGSGLPLYTPKGTVLRDELATFSEELQKKYGFQKVWIPHITKTELYKTSGHWEKFGDELMLVTSQETDDELVLKPMNCPHHTQIYASRPRSYRELPYRIMETTTCYRDERTGELGGLTRVRSLTQDDGHVFCTMDQVQQEFRNIMEMITELYQTLGLSFRARLSFYDPDEFDKYLGDEETWNEAQSMLQDMANNLELDYYIAPGEAAIYGPKIDIMITDALGREWQCATEQLDFIQPQRFELEYTAEDGSKQTPVMIHKALLGTIDRFLGVYIEHTAGAFPLWLSPVQVKVLPIGDAHHEYAQSVSDALTNAGVRTELDESDETLGKKIRAAKTEKAPYYIIIGDNEVSDKTVTLESRDSGESESLSQDSLIEKLTKEIEERS